MIEVDPMSHTQAFSRNLPIPALSLSLTTLAVHSQGGCKANVCFLPCFTHRHRTEHPQDDPKHRPRHQILHPSVKDLLQIRLCPRNNFQHLDPCLLHQSVVICKFSDPRQICQLSSLPQIIFLPQRPWCSRGQDIMMPEPPMALRAQCRCADQRS